MKARPRLLAGLTATALIAGAAPAFAAEVIETTRYYVVPETVTAPTTRYYYVPSTADTTTYYVAPAYTALPSYTPLPAHAPTPTVTEVIYEARPITVEASRLTEDQRITDDVVSVLASDPYLSGRIGVETRDQDVNLTGNLTTPGQIRRAVRDAGSVWGVRNVTSEIRPRVGANTSY